MQYNTIQYNFTIQYNTIQIYNNKSLVILGSLWGSSYLIYNDTEKNTIQILKLQFNTTTKIQCKYNH